MALLALTHAYLCWKGLVAKLPRCDHAGFAHTSQAQHTQQGAAVYLGCLHGASNEVSPKVEVVYGEDGLAGALVSIAHWGTRPIMTVDDVRPAHHHHHQLANNNKNNTIHMTVILSNNTHTWQNFCHFIHMIQRKTVLLFDPDLFVVTTNSDSNSVVATRNSNRTGIVTT